MAPAMVARREWTRRWWRTAVEQCELFTGPPVIEELAAGPANLRDQAMRQLHDLPLLEVEPPVLAVVESYIRHKLMPAVGADALHLALASYHDCDVLATWDRKHLANVRKFAHIRWVNTKLGLSVPEIVTPSELLGEGDDPARKS